MRTCAVAPLAFCLATDGAASKLSTEVSGMRDPVAAEAAAADTSVVTARRGLGPPSRKPFFIWSAALLAAGFFSWRPWTGV